ncbi:zinc-binding alcohol dehydrogenase family protein [Glutamicibacter nicotianae]|uniref:zinc-binding alcohol dehydrogenase family protein n=1 Tax=Glutamicibacter nicotianae TaxID=37929 RepID=UPI00195B56C6|nr:zinc-binding alcohol dehydrogenase family protein [Glutamicibacter nicotianae]MBM7767790.1 zinc-binding alcohol dehydrogenase family protein [Glutamicibacter nicotianae]
MAPATTSELTTIPAVVSRSGGPLKGEDSLADAIMPAPGAPTGHDILVDVKAVSVNPVDVKIRAGAGGPTDDRVLGWDASGIVLAVGDAVTGYQVGDEVYYAGALGRPGTYAKWHLVDERIVGRKPATLTHAEAAALPLTTITAWEALFDKLKLDASSTGTLLVLGAAGGVGSIMIQLAKALTGVKVIATASRDESRAWVSELGADAMVDHSAADFEEQVLREAPGGVDYVFSPQSKGRMPFFVAVTRPFGQIVAIDDEKDLDFMALKGKSISWHWEFMFARPMHGWDLEAQRELLDKASELIDAGALRTTLTKTYSPIDADQLRKAHADVETGHAVGKIVVAAES